jgi:hypothetical protein
MFKAEEKAVKRQKIEDNRNGKYRIGRTTTYRELSTTLPLERIDQVGIQ